MPQTQSRIGGIVCIILMLVVWTLLAETTQYVESRGIVGVFKSYDKVGPVPHLRAFSPTALVP